MVIRAKSKQKKDQERKQKYQEFFDRPFEVKMSELDTARYILKDQNERDQVTREVAYQEQYLGLIKKSILTDYYMTEVYPKVTSPHVQVKATRKWDKLSLQAFELVTKDLVEGQVLNCNVTPCWWR